ncbi:MAG: hypothetical protein P8X79_02800 [Reinekea sp.]
MPKTLLDRTIGNIVAFNGEATAIIHILKSESVTPSMACALRRFGVTDSGESLDNKYIPVFNSCLGHGVHSPYGVSEGEVGVIYAI